MLEQSLAPHGGVSEDEVPLEDGAALIDDLERPAPIVVLPHPSSVGDEVGVSREDV